MVQHEMGNFYIYGADTTTGATKRGWREERRAQRNERRARRPLHGLGFALALILLGILFLLNQQGVISGDTWWQSLLIGLGSISILDGLLHLRLDSRGGSYGKFVFGTILILIGAMFIFGFSQWWSMVLIAAGIAVLVRVFWRR